jgi:hypothetical protein
MRRNIPEEREPLRISFLTYVSLPKKLSSDTQHLSVKKWHFMESEDLLAITGRKPVSLDSISYYHSLFLEHLILIPSSFLPLDLPSDLFFAPALNSTHESTFSRGQQIQSTNATHWPVTFSAPEHFKFMALSRLIWRNKVKCNDTQFPRNCEF